ncbi:hypothetical protein [Sulfitobacter sp. DSM 110093]|uniref:hypothetical protein n=1 Tax=Sulfitobacter sp. DSM 110093 TaxID=2883127 RepID=UPI001FAE50DC|nr:hypothetical protein [Sulfitobacter sp. DSM 110093]
MRPLFAVALLAGALALAGCTPPRTSSSARQDTPPPSAETGISLSGYATVGVVKSF